MVSVWHVFVYNAVDALKNLDHFLGKTAFIDKCAVDLRVTSIAYLIGQSLMNILSQIPAL